MLSSKVPEWKKKTGSPGWRVMEGQEKTGDGKTVKFSIHQIPEDRHNDVLDHMSKFFNRDDAICIHLSKFTWPHGWINSYGYNYICTILHDLEQLLAK